jgi:peptidoglycan biosynthesis protein MviN/MurJ (putative lipid II flippase)
VVAGHDLDWINKIIMPLLFFVTFNNICNNILENANQFLSYGINILMLNDLK